MPVEVDELEGPRTAVGRRGPARASKVLRKKVDRSCARIMKSQSNTARENKTHLYRF